MDVASISVCILFRQSEPLRLPSCIASVTVFSVNYSIYCIKYIYFINDEDILAVHTHISSSPHAEKGLARRKGPLKGRGCFLTHHLALSLFHHPPCFRVRAAAAGPSFETARARSRARNKTDLKKHYSLLLPPFVGYTRGEPTGNEEPQASCAAHGGGQALTYRQGC